MLSFHDYKCAAVRFVAAKALNPRCHMKVLQDDSGLRPWDCVLGLASLALQFHFANFYRPFHVTLNNSLSHDKHVSAMDPILLADSRLLFKIKTNCISLQRSTP